MRVYGNNVHHLLDTYRSHKARGEDGIHDRDRDSARSGGTDGSTAGGDSVDLSSRAAEMRMARRELESVPEVRAELVEELRARIESGQYSVDAGKVAESILRSGDLDRLV